MRYAAALVLLVFAAGDASAAYNPAAECRDAVRKTQSENSWRRVKKHFAAAVTPCTKAAEQGDHEAQTWLGYMYANGFGFPEDDAKAMEWYTKAAEQDPVEVHFILGSMHESGRGFPQDDAKAMEWYTKAAEQGRRQAQYRLGKMLYAAGTGVPEDYVQAYKWVVLALMGTQQLVGHGAFAPRTWLYGHQDARYAHPDARGFVPVKRTMRLRKRLQRKMTAEQVVEAHRLVREWFEEFKAKQDGD